MNEISDVDAAWIAGLLEGEGSFFPLVREGKRTLARTSMGSCDLDVLERLREITGIGSILKVARSDRPSHKPHWTWTVQRHQDAIDLMSRIHHLMGARRADRITEVFNQVDDPLKPFCPRGHNLDDPSNWFMRRGGLACRSCASEKKKESTILQPLDHHKTPAPST